MITPVLHVQLHDSQGKQIKAFFEDEETIKFETITGINYDTFQEEITLNENGNYALLSYHLPKTLTAFHVFVNLDKHRELEITGKTNLNLEDYVFKIEAKENLLSTNGVWKIKSIIKDENLRIFIPSEAMMMTSEEMKLHLIIKASQNKFCKYHCFTNM